jgi:hypothetical protein
MVLSVISVIVTLVPSLLSVIFYTCASAFDYTVNLAVLKYIKGTIKPRVQSPAFNLVIAANVSNP